MVKLTNVTRYTEDKEGNPLKTQDGRTYIRQVIEVEGAHAGKKISGFEGYQSKDWKAGDEVDVEIYQKGEYWNFRVPKKEDQMMKVIEEVQNSITKINMRLSALEAKLNPKDEVPYPEGEPGDVPF